MTTGERRFSEFCRKHGFQFQRVDEESDRQTPDFMLFPAESPIIVEIKDLTNNPEETEALNRLRTDHFAVWGTSKVGNRIRNKIKSAHGQLKQQALSSTPSILVIVDDRDESVSILSSYEIAVAMFGYQTMIMGSDGHVSQRFGSGAQMTVSSRTYISAIGVLEKNLQLDLYLNFYAGNPLNSNALIRCVAVKVYRVDKPPRGSFGDWIQLRERK